jgi:hypothetical protein
VARSAVGGMQANQLFWPPGQLATHTTPIASWATRENVARHPLRSLGGLQADVEPPLLRGPAG